MAKIVDIRTRKPVRASRRCKAPTPATIKREELLVKAVEQLQRACLSLIESAGAIHWFDLSAAEHKMRAGMAYDAAMQASRRCHEVLRYVRRAPLQRARA